MQFTYGERLESKGSEHECHHQSRNTRSHQRGQRSEAELDLEHQKLSLLLKLFPGTSLLSNAEAYTRAEGDLNYAAELLIRGNLSSQFPDVGQRTEEHAADQQKTSEERNVFETSQKPLELSFHFEKKSDQLYEVETGNVGSVVSQGPPGVDNHRGRPPEFNSRGTLDTDELVFESVCQSVVKNGRRVGHNGRNGVNVTSNSLGRGGNGGIAAGNYASNGTGNTSFGSGISLLPGWKGSSHGNKVSAITGTVSCHRQRRDRFPHHDAGKDNKDVRGGGGEVFFHGKQKKRKKKVGKNENTENPTDPVTTLGTAEDFLHSMLGDGFELGLDVVRDVLEHFSGDTNKAVETLLHMASTSPGFQECDEDPVQATSTQLQEKRSAKNNSVSTDLTEVSNFDLVLSKLLASFPSVELTFLSELLQASNCSYVDAVQALKEAGLTPANERGASKVDPAEVLQALFKTEVGTDNTVDAGPSTEQQSTSGELYTVVAGRGRARNLVSDSKAIKAKADEYEKHRGSANDHWSTMKRYFQEAAAAHSRGERAAACVLSEKGQLFKGLAREASLRASETIFNEKNRDIENNLIIDLHAQHVQEAFQLLKLHLRSLSSLSSVRTLTVITGHGSHSASGRARIKPAITQYLTKMHIPWAEPNGGCLIIKMSDVKAHYATHSGSSDDSSNESP